MRPTLKRYGITYEHARVLLALWVEFDDVGREHDLAVAHLVEHGPNCRGELSRLGAFHDIVALPQRSDTPALANEWVGVSQWVSGIIYTTYYVFMLNEVKSEMNKKQQQHQQQHQYYRHNHHTSPFACPCRSQERGTWAWFQPAWPHWTSSASHVRAMSRGSMVGQGLGFIDTVFMI